MKSDTSVCFEDVVTYWYTLENCRWFPTCSSGEEMLIQKTFHVALGVEQARSRLARLGEYRLALADICTAGETGDGAFALAFRLPCGLEAEVVLEEVPAPGRGQAVFKSCRGSLDLVAIAEFFPQQADLTEVVLTLDYTLCPWLHRWVDALFPQMDRFLNRQLAGVERHFSGVS